MNEIRQGCKLCGTIISDDNFKVIEDVIKDIFKILLLKLTLDCGIRNVMCKVCSSKLLAALNFKSKCLYTDNSIIPYVDFDNPKPVDLKEVYAKEKGSEQESKLLDGRKICRLCLQLMGSDYKPIQEVPVDIIQIYIPDINFAITTNPAICLKCYAALHVHSTFIRDCLEVEKKRNVDVAYVDKLLTDPFIKTENIEIKTEQTDDDTLYGNLCCLLTETNNEGDTSFHDLIESEKNRHDSDDLKQTKRDAQLPVASCISPEGTSRSPSDSLSAGHQLRHKTISEVKENESDCSDGKAKQQHSRQTPVIFVKKRLNVQEYQCDKCMYSTRVKKKLTWHKLLHADPSKVKWFKCDECDYKSILKWNFDKHQLKHKHPSLVKTYKCGECDYKSIYKCAVTKHQLIKHKDAFLWSVI